MAAPRKRSEVIREDDLVQVVTPRFVVRVGYPKSLQDYERELQESQQVQDALDALFKLATGRTQRFPERIVGAGPEKHRSRERVERELAYLRAVAKGFGGNERSIHWKEIPELEGVQARVVGVRTAYTGERYEGGMSGPYDCQEYEPAGLADPKAHRILRLELREMRESKKNVRLVYGLNHDERLEIPIYHVRKLTEDLNGVVHHLHPIKKGA